MIKVTYTHYKTDAVSLDSFEFGATRPNLAYKASSDGSPTHTHNNGQGEFVSSHVDSFLLGLLPKWQAVSQWQLEAANLYKWLRKPASGVKTRERERERESEKSHTLHRYCKGYWQTFVVNRSFVVGFECAQINQCLVGAIWIYSRRGVRGIKRQELSNTSRRYLSSTSVSWRKSRERERESSHLISVCFTANRI